ncbi:HAD family phosphatase [Paenibacillus lycopersici]|uniref:HAD family phosphatase n=1 Tax=Paenibacillus lycopersici TaxID=2704462 RepID=A0A6C0FZT2_9BACL|nr:HAD family hydrolase [Paenibacillus lycopersici]QHT61033.1 HAD family phosphatase [Paenibacillus lycopersici]
MIKLIVSDLDGTLLNHSKQIDDRDLRAITKAQANGFEMCIASGRMNAEIQIIMQPFAHGYHAVGQNGATVHLSSRQLLTTTEFMPDMAVRLLQAVDKDAFVNFIHCTDDSYFARVRNEQAIPYEARIMIDASIHADLEQALAADALRCSKLSFFGELEKLNGLQALLADRFAGQIETFISDKDCLDVMPLHVSKGAGLSRLIRKLGLEPEEAACIGDSFNDLSMFAITPHSFAMSGSPETVRAQASEVVHSVAEAIERVMDRNLQAVGN